MNSEGWHRANREPGSNYHYPGAPGLEIAPPAIPVRLADR